MTTETRDWEKIAHHWKAVAVQRASHVEDLNARLEDAFADMRDASRVMNLLIDECRAWREYPATSGPFFAPYKLKPIIAKVDQSGAMNAPAEDLSVHDRQE